MKHPQLISFLAAFGTATLNDQRAKDREYLDSNGWICLGAEAFTGIVHWTNLERGLGPGGPVTFQRAIWIQRTKDAIKRQNTEGE